MEHIAWSASRFEGLSSISDYSSGTSRFENAYASADDHSERSILVLSEVFAINFIYKVIIITNKFEEGRMVEQTENK